MNTYNSVGNNNDRDKFYNNIPQNSGMKNKNKKFKSSVLLSQELKIPPNQPLFPCLKMEKSHVCHLKEESKIAPETEKVSNFTPGIFKQLFGFILLSKDKKNEIKIIEQKISSFNKKKSLIILRLNKLSKYEKLVGKKYPTQKSLNQARRLQAEFNLKLEEMRSILNELNNLKENINEISTSHYRYRNLESNIKKLNEQFDTLQVRKNVIDELIHLEKIMVEYQSAPRGQSFDKFLEMKDQVLNIQNLIVEGAQREEFKKDKSIQKKLKVEKKLDASAIKFLTKNTVPQFYFYAERLTNQFNKMENKRIDELDKQSKIIQKISNKIIVDSKSIHKKENVLSSWNTILTPLMNLSSKNNFKYKLKNDKDKLSDLFHDFKDVAFNQDEIEWLKNKASQNSKLQSTTVRVMKSNQEYQRLESRIHLYELLNDISEKLKEVSAVRNKIKNKEREFDLNTAKNVKINEMHGEGRKAIHLLEEANRELVDERNQLQAELKELLENLASSAKLSYEKYGVKAQTGQETVKFSYLDLQLKFYIEKTFPILNGSIDRTLTSLLALEETNSTVSVEKTIKKGFEKN